MPRVSTKFVADVAVKVGRSTLNFKLPVDLAALDGHAAAIPVGEQVLQVAQGRAREAKVSIVNVAALKKAHKTYRSAHR